MSHSLYTTKNSRLKTYNGAMSWVSTKKWALESAATFHSMIFLL